MKHTTILDNLWRDIVKLIAKHRCIMCKSEYDLHSHHIIKRTYIPTRWLLENGICLCSSCHAIAHSNEDDFKLWVAKKRPLKELEEKKNSQEKLDLYEIEKTLRGFKFMAKT